MSKWNKEQFVEDLRNKLKEREKEGKKKQVNN